MYMDRRLFLTDLSRYAALAAVVPNVWRVTTRPRFADDPFQLGVASGDPTPTGGVLWTRLAPRPFEPDGGMDGLRAVVSWEVADDAQFTKIVQKGRATAAPELSFSVHVDVDGLQPDRWYFYRFMAGEAVSDVGRFRTAPAAGAKTPLAFAFASCQRWDQGLFTAYAHFAQEEIDLAVHLGDYIYEGASPAAALRAHHGLEIRTLDDYRRRYAQYKSDPHLQAAHARCPWLVTWDDHEVDNNYAGLTGENVMESTEQMRARRAAAYQAQTPGFAEMTAPSARFEPAPVEAEESETLPLGAARAQVHENYIIAQTETGIVIVDQHAAHERLVYERLKAQYAETGIASQALLIPDIVEMSPAEAGRLLDLADDLAHLGLVIEPFGGGAIAVRETPAMLGEVDAKGLLQDILDELSDLEESGNLRARIDAILSRVACHGSIRSGRRMRAEEMNALLREMEATPLSGQCNHGRPTYVELKLSDIERLFGRT